MGNKDGENIRKNGSMSNQESSSGIVLSMKFRITLRQLALLLLAAVQSILAPPSSAQSPVRFGVIGDYGLAGQAEADVATLVRNAFYFSDRIASPQGQIIFLSSSGSTFPPLMMAQIFLPFMPPAFFMTAA